MHTYIIDEITGVELENDYKNIVGTVMQLEKEPIKDMAQRAEDARNNVYSGNNVHKTHYHIKEVDDVIEIYSDSDYDHDEDDYIPSMVKREDHESRDDGSEVDPEENQYDALVEELNDGE